MIYFVFYNYRWEGSTGFDDVELVTRDFNEALEVYNKFKTIYPDRDDMFPNIYEFDPVTLEYEMVEV